MFDLLFPKHWSTLKKLIWLKAAALSSAVVKTVTAAIVHIKDALAGPAQNVTIAIEPVQAGTGDPSPDNVRPITGWTGANVYRTGKNLADPSQFVFGDLVRGNLRQGSNLVTGPIRVKPGTVYSRWCSAGAITGGTMEVAFYDASMTYIDRGFYAAFTTPANCAFIRTEFDLYGTAIADAQVLIVVGDGASAVTYEPYQGTTTIPITFPTPPGTVYGGTLDVTTGVLTVTHASVDMGTLNWTYAGSIFRCANIGNALNPNAQTVPNVLCSAYKTLSRAALISMQFVGITINTGSYGEIWVTDSAYDSASSFKTAMSGVQLVYELATPQIYQLTPQDVQLLKGENNIWADTGDTTLTYLADGRASDTEALNILLAGRYHNGGAADEATDKEALEILLGGNR